MVLGVEMSRGMAVRRVVAAADMTARHAQAEVHPPATHAKAVLAAVTARRDLCDLVQMRAGLGHGALLSAAGPVFLIEGLQVAG